MKFKDKLSKKRHENNLSQEALAERLNMSRQAISKWESGSSYPDMSTMINICKVLNCNLEDLLDDDTLGSNFKDNKFSINKYLKDTLDFITKSYNMFISMTFKQKIKCILEMIIIICILILFFTGFAYLLINVFDIFNFIPNNLYFFLLRILKMIYGIFAITISFIILIHLFKIRYLDYFVTIEDNTIKEKIIEKDINKDKIVFENHEKVIIRDPKHSTYSFMSILAKIVYYIFKCFLILLLIPFIISFLILLILSSISLFNIRYIIFIGIFISLIGLILINYNFLEIIISVLFDFKTNLKRLFIMFITGLILTGFGIGYSVYKFLNFKEDNTNFITKTFNMNMNNDLVFDSILDVNKVIIDNNTKDIKIKVNYYKFLDINLDNYENYYYLMVDENELVLINMILDSLRKETYINFDNPSYSVDSITLSQENYDLLLKNIKLYEEY